MRIDIERIQAIKDELNAFNRQDLRSVEFYEAGERIVIPPSVFERWDVACMNNIHFVEFRFWEDEESTLDVESSVEDEEVFDAHDQII